MDRKSLLAGMTLGAVIAFGGMILGGQGQPAAAQPAGQPAAQPVAPNGGAAAPNPGGRQPKVDWFDKISVRQIDIVNAKGKTVMQLSEADDGAYIQIFNAAHQELVRIGNVLRGGGQIMTFNQGKKLVELTELARGGALRVCSLDKDEWVEMKDNKFGPSILGGTPGNWTFEIPPGAGAAAPTPPANPNGAAPANPNGPVTPAHGSPSADPGAPAAPKHE